MVPAPVGTFRHDTERDEELRFHREMAEEDAMRCGSDPRAARLRVGNIAQAAEAVRDQSAIGWLADFLRDSRHGIRLLARTPVFTATAILSLALGIGANTAIFSLIDTVIRRMMPVHEPERLVQFGRDLSYPLFRQFGQELRCFTDMFAHSSMGRRDVIFDEDPEAVSVEFVSGNYYSVLGVSAFAGRTFDFDVDRNPTPVAVFWNFGTCATPPIGFAGYTSRASGRYWTYQLPTDSSDEAQFSGRDHPSKTGKDRHTVTCFSIIFSTHACPIIRNHLPGHQACLPEPPFAVPAMSVC